MMNPNNIEVCPGTLAPGFPGYSPKCIREVFGGHKVQPILSFPSPQQEGAQKQQFLESRTRISISGVQEKYSLRFDPDLKDLALTEKGGTFILKPVPVDLLQVHEVPANEHLTMQIASQVYGLPVAKCALIFFNDGAPAYITRRFDVKEDGTRCLKEDFATLAGLTSITGGKHFKYTYSYAGAAQLIDRYFPASTPAKEQFFRLVVFNYLFSNGDAHLKNFSRIDCRGTGDAFLSPGYDLINTRLHIDDSDLALQGGLYEGDHEHPSYATYGCYCFDDFYEFGIRIGLVPTRVKRMLLQLTAKEAEVADLVGRSFLSLPFQARYLELYQGKQKRLKRSLQGLV